MMGQQFSVCNEREQEIANVEILDPETFSTKIGIMHFRIIDGWEVLEDYCFRRIPVRVSGIPLRIAAFPYQPDGFGYLQFFTY